MSSARAERDPVPELIQLAERWRQAGKIIAARAPDAFHETCALFEAWIAIMSESETSTINEIYRES